MFRHDPKIFEIAADITVPTFDYSAEARPFRRKDVTRGVLRRDRFFAKGRTGECDVPRPSC